MNKETDSLQTAEFMSAGEFAEKISNQKWTLHNHLKYLDVTVTNAILSGNKKLIINMPPRHGKSYFLSEWLPFWYLHNFRGNQIMLATYNQHFATHWGRRVKDLIKEHGHELGLEIRKDVSSANNFKLNTGGGMVCIGARGSLTGRGANLLLIDDPVKNDTEANSLNHRNALWNWFNSTAYTRIEPGGTLILIMTRWHEDDLCGRLLIKQNSTTNTNPAQINSNNLFADSNPPASKNEWISIKIPAIATESDVLGRLAGEPLWGDRFGINQLNDIRLQIGEYWFSALYQQSPAAATGNIFKRKTFRYFYYDSAQKCYILNDTKHNFLKTKVLSSIQETHSQINLFNNDRQAFDNISKANVISREDCKIYAVMDLAATAKQTSDYTVVLIFGVTAPGKVLVLDVIRAKFEGSQHLELLQEVYNLWQPILIGVENVQYQISLVQMARKQNLPVKELRPDKDKVSRCLPITALLEAGKVFFDSTSSWLKEFEDELLAFPHGKHDDQVDAFAYITYMLAPIIDSQRSYNLLVGGRLRGSSSVAGFGKE